MLAIRNSRVTSKAVHSPKDWTYGELKEIDSLLRCPICYDFIHTAMILPECSHTFCSFCIRQHLSHTNKCPICNSGACENNLRNNRLIDDVILQFKSIRSHLLEITTKHSTEKGGSHWNLNKKTLQETKTQSFLPISKNNIASKDRDVIDLISEDGEESEKDLVDPKSNENKENITEVDQGFCTPKAKAGTQLCGLKEAGGLSTPETKSPANLSMFSPSPRKMVPCPVCGISLKESAMNDHLDICLGGEEKKSALRKQTPKRKPMAKLVYNLMSERDIKKKMKEVGLSTAGDKKALIRRHHDFVMLYNSECDSLKPRSVQDIIKEVEKMEGIRHRNKRDDNRLGIEKNSSPATIEKAQKVYMKKHKSHFSNLIEETRRRMKEQKAERKKSLDIKEKSEESEASDTEHGETGTELTQSESEGDSRLFEEDSRTFEGGPRISEDDSRKTSSRTRRNKGTDERISEMDVDDANVISSQSESESKGQRRSTRNKGGTKVSEVNKLETSKACDVEIVSLESDTESENDRPLFLERRSTRSRSTQEKTSESGMEKVLTDDKMDIDSGRRKSLRTRKRADANKTPLNSETCVSQNQQTHDQVKTKSRGKYLVGEETSDSVCELTNVDKTNKNQAGYNKYDRQSSQRRSKRNYSKLYSHSEQSESKKTSYEGEVEETSDTSDVELGLNEELNIERNKRKNSAAVFENEDTSANVAMGAKKSSTEVRKYKTTSSSSNKLVKEASKGEGKFVCIASVHRTSPVADLIINVPVDLEKLDWTEEEEDDGKREKIQRQFLGSPIRIPEINGSRSSSEEDGGVEIISCDDNMDEESEEDRGVEVLSRDDKVDEESKEKGGKKQRSKSKKSHTKVTKNSSKEVIGHCDNVDHNKRDGTDLGISKSPNGKSGSLLSGEQDCQEGEKVIEDQEEDESLQVDETPVKEYDVESFSTLWPALSGGEGVSKARARHFSSMSTQSHKSNCSDLSAVFSPIKVDKDIQEERRSSRSSSRREILGDFENRKRKRLSEPASRKRRRR